MEVIQRGDGKPEITIVGSIHGDEPAGKKAINSILEQDLDYQRPVQFILANEEALEKNKRYLETDLNRSFPGNKESEKHEEKLAAEILEKVKDTVLLDIHTTRSYPEPFATFKSKESNIIELIKAGNVGNGVYFSGSSGTLIGEMEEGVIVEAGYQQTEQAVENSLNVIKNFLGYFNAIDYDYQTSEPSLFEYIETVEGDWKFLAENFKKVEKGEVFAKKEDEELTADKSFYPVLMSTNGYEGKLGFKAQKINEN